MRNLNAKIATKLASIAVPKSDRPSDEGATMVEYGIMLAAVAIVVSAAAFTLGGNVRDFFASVTI